MGDQYDMFVLAENVEKVSFEEDSKVEHAGVFTFMLEDHTLGNLLRMQLL
jgi:DNA-directed RNA polymerase subunit L